MINIKKIKDYAVDVVKRNEKQIIGFIGTIVLGATFTTFDIPIDMGFSNHKLNINRTKEKRQFLEDIDIFFRPKNCIQSSIYSILKSVETMDFDNAKVSAAMDIKEILDSKNTGISDDTESFAIMALSKLIDEMYFDSNKRKVASIIKDIAKGE